METFSQAGGSVAAAVTARPADTRLRVLIVGGGIAGLTLAALLEQRGERPVVIERHSEGAAGGYMLGLLPLGGRVLHGLGLHDTYLARSCPMHGYDFYNRNGRLLKSYSLDRIIDRFGAYQGIERGILVDLLKERLSQGAIHYDTTAQGFKEADDAVDVTFSDGSTSRFDLVVGADGMHSDTRRQIFGDADTQTWSTGWGGWVYWVRPLMADDSTYRELWSTRWGLGLYPVRDRLGVFVAGRVADLGGTDAAEHIEAVRKRLPSGPFREAVDRINRAETPFFWKMEDRRAKNWCTSRLVLIGDAAAGFLPTAGVGASMAMDSAAALADELARAETGRMGLALRLYENRQRSRVERAQKNSRDLAKFMFIDSGPRTFLRDQMMRFYSLDMLVKSISQVMMGR